jgi:ABC-type bacteriocin/lantibiotic exporter with double-glycine peptidase domain
MSDLIKVAKALKIFPLRFRIRLCSFILWLFLVSLMDLLGIFVIGVLLISSTRQDVKNNFVFVKFEDVFSRWVGPLNEAYFTSALLIFAVLLFIFKSLFGVLILDRLFKFLAVNSASISKNILPKIFDKDIQSFQRFDSTKYAYFLTLGMQSLIIDGFGYGVILVSEIFMLLSISMIFFLINTTMTFVIIVYFAATIVFAQKKILKATRQQEQIKTDSYLATHSMIHNLYLFYREFQIPSFRAYSVELFSKHRHKEFHAISNLQILGLLPKYVLELILLLGATSVFFISSYFYGESQAIIVLGLFIVVASRLLPSILRIQTSFSQISRSRISSLDTLNLVLSLGSHDDESVQRNERSCTFLSSDQASSTGVLVKNLKFRYPNGSMNVIDGFNLKIDSPGLYILKGPSGAGKSTLVGLLTGFLIPNSGSIFMYGHSPAVFCPKHGVLIGYLGQEPNLFPGTLRDNINLRNPNVAEDEIINILNRLGLTKFMSLLPEKLDSIVGDNGIRTSGGQTQRLALARVLMLNPKVIVVDEPSSALDSVTEQLVLSELKHQSESKIVIVITHSDIAIQYASAVFEMNTN